MLFSPASPEPVLTQSTPTDFQADSHRTQVQSLLVLHATRVRAFVLGMIVSRDLADDVMQEVFLRISQKADDFEQGTDFVAWACSVARYVVLEQLRKGAGGGMLLPPDVLDALADDFDVQRPIDDRIDLLRFCLNRLAPAARRIVDLRYSGSLKSGQIAEQVGVNTSSVYTTLSRARTLLRACIEAQMRGSKR